MPSLYVDSDLMSLIRDKRDELERHAEGQSGDGSVYVPEKEALEELLDDDVVRQLERKRN